MLNHYRIFGLERYEDIIEDIIRRHRLSNEKLAVQVILTEAISNAYKHGNKEDPEKSIDITVSTQAMEGIRQLSIHVSDEGCGKDCQLLEPEKEEDDILKESGRGLFLISQFSDYVRMMRNHIHIQKCLQEEKV